MIESLRAIIWEAVTRLSQQVRAGLPATIAAIAIMLGALIAARAVRWAVRRAEAKLGLDARLRRAGVSAIVDPRGRVRVSRLLAEGSYWAILIAGLMAALNALGTQTGAFVVDGLISLLPRLAAGCLIVLGGIWLGMYLGRSVLIWAVNEDLPSPRKLAWGTRVLVIFAAAVAAAETLHFASGLFRSSFIVILAGVVLAVSLSVGLGTREMVRRHLEERLSGSRRYSEEGSVWNHL